MRRVLACVAAVVCACTAVLAQEPSPTVAPAPAPAASKPAPVVKTSGRVAHLEQRLEKLEPGQPRAYFELGEEVASEAADDGDRRLARQLYVLAYELSKRGDRPDAQLASSVCLALAAIAETDDERRWLAALGETLAPEGLPDTRRIKSTAVSRDPAAFDLATMLSFVRTGEGRRAEKLLAKPGVAALLDKCDKLLLPTLGGANLVRKHIDEWPICAQCRNRRFVKDGSGVHLCPTCKGTPGPTLSQAELVGEIRTESVLLSGTQKSWAGQMIADGGATLRELDASELAATYFVDAGRPLWRNGRWEGEAGPSKKVDAGPRSATGAAAKDGDGAGAAGKRAN